MDFNALLEDELVVDVFQDQEVLEIAGEEEWVFGEVDELEGRNALLEIFEVLGGQEWEFAAISDSVDRDEGIDGEVAGEAGAASEGDDLLLLVC